MSQNQVPYKDQVASVQTAVDQFKEESGGLLPIKRKIWTRRFIKNIRLTLRKLFLDTCKTHLGIRMKAEGYLRTCLWMQKQSPRLNY